MSRDRRDLATFVLAWTVPLLPAARREWGQAMLAELARIESPGDRWRFARGCVLAIVSRPAPGALVSLAAPVGAVLATVLLTARTAYLPLRIALIAMAFSLGVLHLSGDRAPLFAPIRPGSRLATAVRAGGALTLAGLAVGIVVSNRSGGGDVVDRAATGVPVFTVLIGLYLVGFLSLTSPALADRRVLARGTGLGVAAAGIWLASALARPPLPLSNRSAVAVLAIAVIAAAVVGAAHQAAGRTALCTVLVGALSIFALAQAALAFGPAAWVPSDTAALTPAARLAQSRVEAGESYLELILIGVIAAIVTFAVALRRQAADQWWNSPRSGGRRSSNAFDTSAASRDVR